MSSRILEMPGSLGRPAAVSAGLGLRLGASAIDFVVVATLSIVVALCSHIVLLLLPESAMAAEPFVLAVIGGLITATYFVYSWGYEGATLGQRMLGLCVTRPGEIESCAPIGTGPALLRLIGFAAGSVSLLGLIVALLRWDRRALHDLIADSIVIPEGGAARYPNRLVGCGRSEREDGMPRVKRFGTMTAAAAIGLLSAQAISAEIFYCGAGDTVCLSTAINMSNFTPEADVIYLSAGTYTLTWLCCSDMYGWSGLAPVTGQLTIFGAGRDATIIQRDSNAPQFRIFEVGATGDLTLEDLTIRGGYSKGDVGLPSYGGVGILNFGRLTLVSVAVRDNLLENSGGAGAGIRNDVTGTLSMIETIVSGNSEDGRSAPGEMSTAGGAGIWSDGSLSISLSSITGNWTRPYGGNGAGIVTRGNATISTSTISGNTAGQAAGGGIYAEGTLAITECTISGNFAGGLADDPVGGGGIFVAGNVTVNNSTFAQNWASASGPLGGAIRVAAGGSVALNHSTIADNRVEGLGGEKGGGIDSDGTVQLQNSIVARNTQVDGTGPDCYGVIGSQGHNVVGDLTGCNFTPLASDHVGDAGLGTFTDDGAPGHGHIPLLPTSIAIDAADPATSLLYDQLLRSRVDGNVDGTVVADIGAAEFKTPVVNALVVLDTSKSTLNSKPVKGGPAGTLTISATLTNVSGELIYAPYLVLRSVKDGALLLSADQPPGRVGSRQTPSVGPDNILAAGERVTVTIVFGLQEFHKPAFAFDVLGGAGAWAP